MLKSVCRKYKQLQAEKSAHVSKVGKQKWGKQRVEQETSAPWALCMLDESRRMRLFCLFEMFVDSKLVKVFRLF